MPCKMKLTNKQIDFLIKEYIGADVIKVIDILRKRKNVSEFKIAEKLNLNINNIRNMLYRLGEHDLVGSVRKKDKKKGWYIYYWSFNSKKSKDFYFDMKKRKLNELKRILEEEKNQIFFVCPRTGIRMNYDEALEHDFICPESGELMQEESKDKLVKLEKEINKLEAELTLI